MKLETNNFYQKSHARRSQTIHDIVSYTVVVFEYNSDIFKKQQPQIQLICNIFDGTIAHCIASHTPASPLLRRNHFDDKQDCVSISQYLSPLKKNF